MEKNKINKQMINIKIKLYNNNDTNNSNNNYVL